MSKKQSHQVGRTGATTNIAVEVSDMRQQLAAVDALVRAVVAENEPLLGEWQAIVRNAMWSLMNCPPRFFTISSYLRTYSILPRYLSQSVSNSSTRNFSLAFFTFMF